MTSASAALLSSRALIRVNGPDAAEFLQGLISNDIARATGEAALYAALLTPQGKFLHDFLIVRQGEDYLIDTPRMRRDDLVQRLLRYRLRAKVTVAADDDLAVAAIWGGGANADGDVIAAPDPRVDALGTRLWGPEPALRAAFARVDASMTSEIAYHAYRMALGVPEGDDFAPEQAFLLEGNAEELHGVDFRKGCYVGQELTARMKHRGTARRRILIVHADGALPAPGTPLTAEGGEIGVMRGSSDSVGLALVRLDRLPSTMAAEAGGIAVRLAWPAYLSPVHQGISP